MEKGPFRGLRHFSNSYLKFLHVTQLLLITNPLSEQRQCWNKPCCYNLEFIISSHTGLWRTGRKLFHSGFFGPNVFFWVLFLCHVFMAVVEMSAHVGCVRYCVGHYLLAQLTDSLCLVVCVFKSVTCASRVRRASSRPCEAAS